MLSSQTKPTFYKLSFSTNLNTCLPISVFGTLYICLSYPFLFDHPNNIRRNYNESPRCGIFSSLHFFPPSLE